MRLGLALRTASAIAAALLVAACGGGSKAGRGGAQHVTPLKLEASVGGVDAVQAWANAAQRLSGGELRIQVTAGTLAHDGKADFERRELARARADVVPMTAVGARVFDTVGVRSFEPLLAPFLVDGSDIQQRVLASGLPTRMLAGTKRIGMVAVAVLPGPLRRVIGGARPLHVPADFRGRTVQIQDGAVAAETFRALGARPVAAGQEQPITGLDAYEAQLGAIPLLGDSTHYATSDLTLWPRWLVVAVNAKVYSRLTKRDREAMAQAGAAALGAEMASVRTNDADAVRALCGKATRRNFRIVTSTPAERAAIRAAVAPVYAQIERDPTARATVAQIEAMKRRATPDATIACAGAPGHALAGAPTGLNGVYRMSISAAAEARREHVAVADATPENYGDFVLVIRGGRMATTQQNTKACTWGYGALRRTGGRLTTDMIDGGGIGPDNAIARPGDHFVQRVSLYRNVLTLDPITPPDLPPQTWRRVSAAPRASVFPRRCAPPPGALGG